MTNKERYQRTFSKLHASEQFDPEGIKMTMTKSKKRLHISKFTAVCAAAVLALGMGTTAYAADIGGIQRTIQIWLHGDQTSAELQIEQGDHTTYTMTYEDENGDKKEVHGGGVAYDMWGNEIPITEEDIMRDVINQPEVDIKEDGTAFVYFKNQSVEITDKFDEQGICYTQVTDGDKTYYMTINKNGGYHMNTSKYPSAEEVLH